MKYLFIISAAFSLLFFLLLITKKSKRQEHWFLAAIFFLITINTLFVFFFSRSDTFFYIPGFSELNYALPFLYGPLFWFYTKTLVQAKFKFGQVHYWHLFPFVIFLFVLLLPFFLDIKLPASKLLGYPLLKLLITPFYLFNVLLLLNKYRKGLLNVVSNTEKINLLWLDWITVGAIILWLIAVIGYIYNCFTPEAKLIITDYFILCFLTIYLFALAYIAFTKTDLFQRENIRYNRDESFDIESDDKSILEKTDHDELLKADLDRLILLMEKDKPFLDPQLTLNRLSELSKIPQYKISKSLNTIQGQNFFDFINSYRVEQVKTMIKDGQAKQLSLLGIALESGFNSKASFNRIFKKMTGMTPSQFEKTC